MPPPMVAARLPEMVLAMMVAVPQRMPPPLALVVLPARVLVVIVAE
jgi:hypothetical protein